MDRLLSESAQLQKLAEIAEEERDRVVQQLNLANEQLATEQAMAEAAETSLAAQSTYLDESLVENDKLRLLLVEKDLAKARAALNSAGARVARVEKMLDEAKAKVAKAEMRARVAEGALGEA